MHFILLSGGTAEKRREFAYDLADLIPRSLVVSFATPLREAYRTIFNIPPSYQLTENEEKDCAFLVTELRRVLCARADFAKILYQRCLEKEEEFFIVEDATEFRNDVKSLRNLLYDNSLCMVGFENNYFQLKTSPFIHFGGPLELTVGDVASVADWIKTKVWPDEM